MGKYLKKSLTNACVIFTAMVFIFYLFGFYASNAQQPAMTADMITALFLASLSFSISAILLKFKRIPAFLAYALHCILCVLTVFLLYVNVLGNGATPAGKMVCIVLSVAAYAVIMAVRGLIISVLNKRKDD